MIEEQLTALLETFGVPVHPLVLPGPDPVLPAIVYQRITGVDDHSHDGPGRVRARYQVSFWGATFKAALDLYEAADAVLDGFRSPEGVTIMASGTYDDEDESTRGLRPMGFSRRIGDYVVNYAKNSEES